MDFKRSVWEASLIEAYSEQSPLSLITTAPTEMNATTVIFNKANAGTIGDYDGTIAWEKLETTPIEMTFDHKKYFAFTVDDVDKAQTNIAVVDDYMKVQADLLSSAADTYAFAKYAAGAGSKLSNKLITSPGDLYNYIVKLGAALGKKKVPAAGRYVILDWDALALLEQDKRFTHNPDILENGIISGDKINGMTVVVSNGVPANTVLAIYRGAVGYGEQINEMEALRLESSFADGIRGLNVAAAAVLNSDGVAALTYTIDTNTIDTDTSDSAATAD